MPQTLYPGVYTLEIDAQPKVTGVGATTGGFIGFAEKGPINKAILCTSLSQFETMFGTYYKFAGSSQTYLAFAVNGFFKSGGTACWIVRIPGTTPATTSGSFVNLNTFAPASYGVAVATVSAQASGAYYNKLYVDNMKALGACSTTIPVTGGTAIKDLTLGTGEGAYFEPGDIIHIEPTAGNGSLFGGIEVNGASFTDTGTGGDLTLSGAFEGYVWASGDTFTAISGIPVSGSLVTTPITISSRTNANTIVLGADLTTGSTDASSVVGYITTAQNSYARGSGQIQGILSVSGDVITLTRGIKSADADTITAASIRTASRHRKLIYGFYASSTELVTGSTYIDVISGAANGLVQGQQLMIAGTADGGAASATASGTSAGAMASCIVTVDQVTQYDLFDRISFLTAVTLTGDGTKIKGTSTSTQPPIIASLETTLNVYYAGSLIETHEFLSYHPSNARDYIGSSTKDGRLYGNTTNESNLISVAVTSAVTDNSVNNHFMTSGTQAITSLRSPTVGSDGTLPASASAVVTPTALEALKAAVDLSMLACPDIAVLASASFQSQACKLLSDFSADNSDVMVFISGPNLNSYLIDSTAVQNMVTWRNLLPIDSNRTALYWPYLTVENPSVATSPSVSSTAFSFGVGKSTINIPPEGHVMGQCAKITASRGPHVSPANYPHVGVYDVSYHATDSDQSLLNPKGINAIRLFAAQGVRTYGARTLWSIKDGRHYVSVVRLLQFIERSIREGNRFAVFQPNDPLLWAQITAANRSFLSSIWQQGMLFPSNDESQAYFVKCDADVNPPSERAEGRVNCLIGVNPPKPAEFVVFKIGIFDGASEIEEIIQGANAAGFFVG